MLDDDDGDIVDEERVEGLIVVADIDAGDGL